MVIHTTTEIQKYLREIVELPQEKIKMNSLLSMT